MFRLTEIAIFMEKIDTKEILVYNIFVSQPIAHHFCYPGVWSN